MIGEQVQHSGCRLRHSPRSEPSTLAASSGLPLGLSSCRACRRSRGLLLCAIYRMLPWLRHITASVPHAVFLPRATSIPRAASLPRVVRVVSLSRTASPLPHTASLPPLCHVPPASPPPHAARCTNPPPPGVSWLHDVSTSARRVGRLSSCVCARSCTCLYLY